MQISNILPTGLPHECLANLMIYFTSYDRKRGQTSSVDNILQLTYWEEGKKKMRCRISFIIIFIILDILY